MTTNDRAPAESGARTATLGGRLLEIQRPNGVKAARALAELKGAGSAVTKVTEEWGDYVQRFERSHAVELDRAQARLRYGQPLPIITDTGEAVVYPEGHPQAGEVAYAPSQLDALTEADWQSAGNVLRRPASPSMAQTIGAVLPTALEAGEDRVWTLLALFTLENTAVALARKTGTLDKVLEDRVEELLGDAFADELLELAVAVGETIDYYVRGKVEDLGERVGNALRLVGIGSRTPQPQTVPSSPPQEEEATTEPSTSSSSSSRPTSPTDSDGYSDGDQTSPSDNRGTYSPPSADAMTQNEPELESSATLS
jgi:hypothetical protein